MGARGEHCPSDCEFEDPDELEAEAREVADNKKGVDAKHLYVENSNEELEDLEYMEDWETWQIGHHEFMSEESAGGVTGEFGDEVKTAQFEVSSNGEPLLGGSSDDLREALESSNRLKRILEEDVAAPLNGHSAKRRRLIEGWFEGPGPGDAAKIQHLLQRWKIPNDVAARYVLETTSVRSLVEMLKGSFIPDKNNPTRSCAEQVNVHIIQHREKFGPSGGPLDAVAAFKYRWQLNERDEALLRGLNHKDLRSVLREYDGSRHLHEVVEEAQLAIIEEGKTTDAAPDAPGSETIGRFLRLELIDPHADALVVGDANLTFSLLLAKHRKALCHVGRIIATTFESIEILQERYDDIKDTIKQLQEHNAEVWHSVDCTRIALDPRFRGLEESFKAVYYNFPHAGAVRGFFDAHPFVRWRHENLMQLFFRALRAFVKPGGSVKVCSNKNASGVRYSDIIGAATFNDFVHVETVPFMEWQLRRYQRAFGDKRDIRKRPEGDTYTSQRADQDMVYSFCFAPTGEQLPKAPIKMPPACSDLVAATSVCACGFICQSQQPTPYSSYHLKPSGAHQVLKGTQKWQTVNELYQRFLSEISGVHVG